MSPHFPKRGNQAQNWLNGVGKPVVVGGILNVTNVRHTMAKQSPCSSAGSPDALNLAHNSLAVMLAISPPRERKTGANILKYIQRRHTVGISAWGIVFRWPRTATLLHLVLRASLRTSMFTLFGGDRPC